MGWNKLFVSALLLVLMLGLGCGSSQAHTFVVGGKDGWVSTPSENFNHWAERHRFQVNDTLLFKYKKGSNSVLVVSKENYDSCNTKAPKQSLADGESIFKFDRSGSFFFISGNAEDCQNGQKLVVVVLAVRVKTPPKSPGSPSASSPPAVSPSPTNIPPSDLTPPQPPKKNSAAVISGVGFMVFACAMSTALLGNFVVLN